MMKILIADQLSILSEVLQKKFGYIKGMEFVRTPCVLADLPEQVRAVSPHIIILGIRSFSEEQVEFLKIIRREGAARGIIVFSYHDLMEYEDLFRKAGADFFFTQSRDLPTLMDLVSVLIPMFNPYSKKMAVEEMLSNLQRRRTHRTSNPKI